VLFLGYKGNKNYLEQQVWSLPLLAYIIRVFYKINVIVKMVMILDVAGLERWLYQKAACILGYVKS